MFTRNLFELATLQLNKEKRGKKITLVEVIDKAIEIRKWLDQQERVVKGRAAKGEIEITPSDRIIAEFALYPKDEYEV